jgi:hypothetical protein
MKEVRVLAASSVLGSGFLEDSLRRGLDRDPAFIGCDGGSTDPGPYFLATGETAFSPRAIYRDLRLLVLAGKQKSIPVLIGSCGTGGADCQVDLVLDLLRRVAAEEKISLRVATFYSEQDKRYLKQKLARNEIAALENAPPISNDVIDHSVRIVGMAGAEAFQAALESRPDVVLGGRASDTAIFAAIPLQHGISPGICWHAAKILECGAAATKLRKTPDCLFATLRNDHFVVEPLDPDLQCTPQSVASHALYENADPEEIAEPGGVLKIRGSTYEAVSSRAVKVGGSSFETAGTYTVKLEGVERAGWQTILIGSIRDPFIIAGIDDWVRRLKEAVARRAESVLAGVKGWDFVVRIYGKDGTMGALEPTPVVEGHEIVPVFEILAPDKETAHTLASIVRHQALHLPIKKWSGLITSVAFLYNPAHLDRGELYRFNLKHVVQPRDPLEMFRFGTTTL